MEPCAAPVVKPGQSLSRRETELKKTQLLLGLWRKRLKRTALKVGRLEAKEKRLLKPLREKVVPAPRGSVAIASMGIKGAFAHDLMVAAQESAVDQKVVAPEVTEVTELASTGGFGIKLDDGLDVPEWMKADAAERDRNRKLQAMANPMTKEKKAERKAIEREVKQAELTGKRRKMPLTGKAALAALKE
jgi:hypothetical protein